MSSTFNLLNKIEQLRSELALVHKTKDERIAELCKSEERLTLAMRSTGDGLWDWDLESDEVYYSPRWKSQLGYDVQELENTIDTWASIIHKDDKQPVLEKVQEYLNGKDISFDVVMRMRHKEGHYILINSCAYKVLCPSTQKPLRIIGTHIDVTKQNKAQLFNEKNIQILEMIAKGEPASHIYDAIALLYEERHPGMRCSMLELYGDILHHGGAPSLPKEYCDAVHGFKSAPNSGSCGTSTYTGKRVIVENIETDPKWADSKHIALPHGMRSCWSEPIKSSTGEVLGAFGMYYNHPATPNDDESTDLTSAAMLASIVMERDKNQQRIRNLAYKDQLTGLSSRAHLHLSITKLIQESVLKNGRFSLLYIDLDDFKNINDNLGHDIGDLHLQKIAKRLSTIANKVIHIARLGGDEFCIVINEQEETENAAKIAQACIDVISKPSVVSGRKFIQTCSIGIAHYPNDGQELQSLLKAADTALYTAKGHGKNQYALYNRTLTEEAEYRFKVEQYLRDAIDNKKLYIVYQPQVDINTGKIIGVEALSRWFHPKLGQVSPVDFIVIAERIGMIKQLTESVLMRACTQAVLWEKAGFAPLNIAVNISPSHFLDKDFLPLINHIIKLTGISPTRLELEVTESVAQTSPENIAVFKNLKKIGVLIAIDDFGTGYSSFASLKHLYVDFLKIDKYFIDDMLSDKKTRLLVSSMIEMGHNLEHQIIAEGVENIEQSEVLKALGCETAQGYLYSKPVCAEEITKLLRSN